LLTNGGVTSATQSIGYSNTPGFLEFTRHFDCGGRGKREKSVGERGKSKAGVGIKRERVRGIHSPETHQKSLEGRFREEGHSSQRGGGVSGKRWLQGSILSG